MTTLKAIEVKYEWSECPDYNSTEIFSTPCDDLPHDYRMLAEWLISNDGSKLTVEYTGVWLTLRPIYE